MSVGALLISLCKYNALFIAQWSHAHTWIGFFGIHAYNTEKVIKQHRTMNGIGRNGIWKVRLGFSSALHLSITNYNSRSLHVAVIVVF